MKHILLFSLDTRDYQWEVSHLFEHLVINGFYKLANEHKHNPALIGWIDANTFEDRIYIECGFYDGLVARLFENYMENLPVFSDLEVSAALKITEAEDKTLYAVRSNTELKKQITGLSRLVWNNEYERSGESSINLLQGKKSSANFRDVTIGIYADKLTEDEEKVFLRAFVLINDYVVHIIRSQINGYSRGSTPVQKDDQIMGALTVFTLPKNVTTTRKLNSLIEEGIEIYRTELNMDEIDKHFSVFSATSLWKSLAVFYYRWTGINTTTLEIAGLATEDNIKSLLSKIKIHVRPSHENDYSNL